MAFSVTFHCWNSALLYAVTFVVVFVDVGVVNVVVGVVLFSTAVVGVAEVVITAAVDLADNSFGVAASGANAAVVEIVGVVDTAASTSAIVSSVEAKTVDDGNTEIVVVFVVVFAVVVAVIASTSNNAVVLADILYDVALAFAIGRTAFVSA